MLTRNRSMGEDRDILDQRPSTLPCRGVPLDKPVKRPPEVLARLPLCERNPIWEMVRIQGLYIQDARIEVEVPQSRSLVFLVALADGLGRTVMGVEPFDLRHVLSFSRDMVPVLVNNTEIISLTARDSASTAFRVLFGAAHRLRSPPPAK